MVYISFLISHVPPAHSFFQKKSILIKSDTKFSSTYFLTLTKLWQINRTNAKPDNRARSCIIYSGIIWNIDLISYICPLHLITLFLDSLCSRFLKE